MLDRDLIIEYVNPAFCDLLEYNEGDMAGRSLLNFVQESDHPKIKDNSELVFFGESITQELNMITYSGGRKIVRATGVPFGGDNNTEKILAVVTDVTELKELQSELLKLAREDALTGLYNRFYLNERVRQEVSRSSRYGHPVSFVMIDVNFFKQTNDRFSHMVGDKVLKDIAGILKEALRQSDLAFRFGGDEFLVMLPETGEAGAEELVKRIEATTAEYNSSAEKREHLGDFRITLSFGTATWRREKGKDVEEVINESDLKMYEDKKRKKGVRDDTVDR